MEKKKLTEEIVIIFWLFIAGSILGYIWEMLLVLFEKGHFESRQGLIYGPFIPVYGAGAVVYYLIIRNVKTKSKIKIFFITMILGGITEYIFSFAQEKAFGTISWDYSNLKFNLNGRTSLMHCTFWGIAGILYVTFVEPIVNKMREKINNTSLKLATTVLSVFMIFDISISCIAAGRQAERKKNIAPEGELDIFLDQYYPDEYMNKIFANRKETS